VKRDAALHEQDRRSLRPNVFEKHRRICSREDQRDSVSVKRHSIQPRATLATVRRIAEDEPAPLLQKTVVEFVERRRRARPRLIDGRARIQVKRPKSIDQILWRDPGIGRLFGPTMRRRIDQNNAPFATVGSGFATGPIGICDRYLKTCPPACDRVPFRTRLICA